MSAGGIEEGVPGVRTEVGWKGCLCGGDPGLEPQPEPGLAEPQHSDSAEGPLAVNVFNSRN